MVTHSSILDWRILWTEEVGGLWYIVLQRVGHATHTGCHWASLVALVVKNLFASAGLGSSPGVGNDMYRCESWTIKNAEYQKIEAFELWCWRRLLRVPWTSRRSNQSILKEINPEYSLEGLMLKLTLQYFGHLM